VKGAVARNTAAGERRTRRGLGGPLVSRRISRPSTAKRVSMAALWIFQTPEPTERA